MKLKSIFALTTTLGLMLISVPASYAQAVNLKEPDPFQSNEQNPLYGGGGLDPMQLIHNSNLLNSRSASDFIEDSNESLTKAAQEFRERQLEMMEQQQLESNPSGEEN